MSRRGRALALVGVVLLVGGANGGVQVAGASGVAAFVVIVWAFVSSRRSLRPEVDIGLARSRVTVGDLANASVRLHNRSNRTTTSFGADLLAAGGRRALGLPAVEPGASVEVAVGLPTLERGAFEVGPVDLSSVDPLGLMRSGGLLGPVLPFLVHPRRVALGATAATRRHGFDGDVGGLRRLDAMAMSVAREYENGDDIRFVHWPTSARTGRLMVRYDVTTTAPELAVVLDLRSECWTPARFEEGVSIAASLVESLARADAATLLVLDGTGSTIAPNDPTAMVDALDRFARVGTHASHERGWAAAPPSAPLFVVTGAVGADDLAAADALAAGRPSVVVIAVGGVPSREDRGRAARIVSVRSADDLARRWGTGP